MITQILASTTAVTFQIWMACKINKRILSKKVISLFFIELASSILWLANVFDPAFEVIAVTTALIFLSLMFSITLQLKITRLIPVLLTAMLISVFVIRNRSYLTSLVAIQIFLSLVLMFILRRLSRQLRHQQLCRSRLPVLLWQHAGVFATHLGSQVNCCRGN